jgi:hypothetical protein
MKLQQTVKRVEFGGRVLGSGWVLFGYPTDGAKWFERRFESADAAKKYAANRGWTVGEEPARASVA